MRNDTHAENVASAPSHDEMQQQLKESCKKQNYEITDFMANTIIHFIKDLQIPFEEILTLTQEQLISLMQFIGHEHINKYYPACKQQIQLSALIQFKTQRMQHLFPLFYETKLDINTIERISTDPLEYPYYLFLAKTQAPTKRQVDLLKQFFSNERKMVIENTIFDAIDCEINRLVQSKENYFWQSGDSKAQKLIQIKLDLETYLKEQLIKTIKQPRVTVDDLAEQFYEGLCIKLSEAANNPFLGEKRNKIKYFFTALLGTVLTLSFLFIPLAFSDFSLRFFGTQSQMNIHAIRNAAKSQSMNFIPNMRNSIPESPKIIDSIITI